MVDVRSFILNRQRPRGRLRDLRHMLPSSCDSDCGSVFVLELCCWSSKG